MKSKMFRLDELVNFSPTRPIKRGTKAPFVEMASIAEGVREVERFELKEYDGSGSRFANGDTLFARITPCLENGKTAKVDFLDNGIIGHGSTEFIVMSAKDIVHDEDLIYYLCRLPAFRKYAKSRMQGTSGRQRVDWRALADFVIELPSNADDRLNISLKLKALDDKIRVNKKINSVLESISQTLFKSWFIDFDPVRAKVLAIKNAEDPQLAAMQVISGKSAEELSQLPKEKRNKLGEIADLFPDQLEKTKDGEIPKGWIWKPLYETAEYINGAAFKAADFSKDNSGLPIIKIAELKSGITPQTKFTLKNMDPKYGIDNGSMLYSWSGSPETSLETFKWFGGKGWLNQHIFLINTDLEEQKVYVFNLLKHLKPVLIAIAKNKQTTGLGHVTVADMRRIMIPYPDNNGLKLIGDFLRPLYEMDSINTIQSENLKLQRDTLLPILFSGKFHGV